jgi:hypothetical protein
MERGVERPLIVYTDLDKSRLLRTFGEGCQKIFVIRAVLQLSHFLGYRSENFFQLNTLG